MSKKLVINFSLILLALGAPIIYSYEYGPDPGYTGAPGDNPTGCIYSQCHVGTPNSGPGSITIAAAGAGTYVPGQTQPIQVTIADPTKTKFGFELTARVDSNATTQNAGTLATVDPYTQVITCQTPGVQPYFYLSNQPGCSNLEWIEHNLTGFTSSTPQSYTYNFNWTPPASDVGTVTLYAAGNAGTGNLASPSGTNVYLTKLQLCAAATGVPAISNGGIVPIFSSSSTIQPGSWISIYGQNLGGCTSGVSWNGDFPTTLGGASVTINGNPAYLSYSSPTLINLQAPDDTSRGTVSVVVTNGNGSSSSTVTLGDFGPSFSSLDGQHVAAIILRSNGKGAYGGGTYDLVGPTGSSLGYPTVAAKAGDSVVLFGVGFGPTNPSVPAGQNFSGSAAATTPVQIAINGHTLAACGSGSPCAFAGLGGPGLFQFNITMPSGMGTGDQPLVATVGGVKTQANIVLSLQ